MELINQAEVDEEILKDYPRLKREYALLHEQWRHQGVKIRELENKIDSLTN